MKEEFFSVSSLDGQESKRIQSALGMKYKTTEKDFNNTFSNSYIKENDMLSVNLNDDETGSRGVESIPETVLRIGNEVIEPPPPPPQPRPRRRP
jgi:hypothetical protein